MEENKNRYSLVYCFAFGIRMSRASANGCKTSQCTRNWRHASTFRVPSGRFLLIFSMECYLKSSKFRNKFSGNSVMLFPDKSRTCSVVPMLLKLFGATKLSPHCRIYSSRILTKRNASSPIYIIGFPSRKVIFNTSKLLNADVGIDSISLKSKRSVLSESFVDGLISFGSSCWMVRMLLYDKSKAFNALNGLIATYGISNRRLSAKESYE